MVWVNGLGKRIKNMARNKIKREPEYLEDVEIIDAGAEGMSVAKPEGRVGHIYSSCWSIVR